MSPRNMTLCEKQSLIERELDRLQETHPPPTRGLPRQLQEVLEDLHRHVHDPDLTVEWLRERHRLRNNNFSSQFRLATGKGVRRYIEDLRLTAAKVLLRQEELEVFLIAASVGYAHHESFSRAFRRREGCTPTEYRAMLRANVKKRR